MAAGLGTRFGSLKQLQPVYKEYAIMDFSIYDAISAGFNTIVFIVRKEILETFKTRYLNVFSKDISVEFVIQDTNNIPKQYSINRSKPWGTGHALLILKDIIKTPFALINADDFYGKNAFKLMHHALYETKNNDNYFIGFSVDKTLSKTGSVSRGECIIDTNNYLQHVTERTQISKSKNGKIIYKNENNESIEMSSNTIVSMNFWGFHPAIFPVAEELFISFLETNANDNKAEFYLPTIVDASIKSKNAAYKMVLTNQQWFGITYQEDLQLIKDTIESFMKQNIYPENLW